MYHSKCKLILLMFLLVYHYVRMAQNIKLHIFLKNLIYLHFSKERLRETNII